MRKMTTVTDEQWERYLDQYNGLLWTIARKISGDEIVASIEDNYADLCLAAIESIRGYELKTGKAFDEAFGEKLFDQYTKTVLWNRKNKKGLPLTKRMPFRNKHVSISSTEDFEKGFDIDDDSWAKDVSSINLEDMFGGSDEDVKKVVATIVKDPSVVTKEGKVKANTLVAKTGLSAYFVNKALEKIGDTLIQEGSYAV